MMNYAEIELVQKSKENKRLAASLKSEFENVTKLNTAIGAKSLNNRDTFEIGVTIFIGA